MTEPLLLAVPAAADPAATVLLREQRAQLVGGLARLSEPHRRVVTCRYLLDLDEAETATVLGWPRGTVKSRLHRALAQLSQALDALPAAGSTAAVGGDDRPREVRHGS